MANRENVQLWVNALESGEFKQGRGSLKNSPNQYCCLGVACEIFHRETGTGRWDGDTFVATREGCMLVLPLDVSDWFGVAINPVFMFRSQRCCATELNDNDLLSFKEIAALIRAQILEAADAE